MTPSRPARASSLLVRLLLLILVVSPAARVIAESARPNIIFFLSDDHRNDLLGCAGHPILKTPTLDRLAGSGVRFTDMFVTTSICAASRASLLSGLHERTHRYTFGTPPLGEDHARKSYPALLKKAGYRTGFVGKLGVNIPRELEREMFDVLKKLNRSPYFKKQADGSLRHVSEIAGDRAIEFLESREGDQPFCLSVSFNAPHAEDSDKENHYPWPRAVDGLYDDVVVPAPRLSAPGIFESQPEFLKTSLNRKRWYWRWDTPEKYQKNVKAYYRMISGIDHVMGRVLAAVERLGLAENTVVIFSGDNGYYKGARGFAGKWSHYEESLRVPLIIHDPRLAESRRGVVESRMVLNIDIPATILDVAGVPVPGSHQGRSLLSLLRGEKIESWREDLFCEHLMEHRDIPKFEGIRGGRYVYARYFQQEPVHEFLHDLDADPLQLENFVDDPRYAEVLERLRARCDARRDELGGEFRPWPRTPRRRR